MQPRRTIAFLWYDDAPMYGGDDWHVSFCAVLDSEMYGHVRAEFMACAIAKALLAADQQDLEIVNMDGDWQRPDWGGIMLAERESNANTRNNTTRRTGR